MMRDSVPFPNQDGSRLQRVLAGSAKGPRSDPFLPQRLSRRRVEGLRPPIAFFCNERPSMSDNEHFIRSRSFSGWTHTLLVSRSTASPREVTPDQSLWPGQACEMFDYFATFFKGRFKPSNRFVTYAPGAYFRDTISR